MRVEISNRQSHMAIDETRLRQAILNATDEAGFTGGEISLAIVDDTTIQQINSQFLSHDYTTDVISFVLDQDGSALEGEIIVSADTARRVASQVGWSPDDELLLYVIHGALHLVGHDDTTPDALLRMREQERRHLALFGLERRASEEEKGTG